MACNSFVRSYFTLLLFSVGGWQLAMGQIGYELLEARLEFLYEKFAEAMKCNDELIKQIQSSTREILSRTPLCRIEHRNLICTTSSSGAGWIVIQQQYGGSVNFNRSWAEYRDGFGSSVGEASEFWWGLERLHQRTKTGAYELLIELEDSKGEFAFARYSEFVVEGESAKYRLAKLGGYSGVAGDVNILSSRSIPSGQRFSTYDSDNDNWSSDSCASNKGSGWWFNDCGSSLNSYAAWYAWTDDQLPYTRMLIRAKP